MTKHVALVGYLALILVVSAARADSWIGDSFELVVADSDLLVRGTITSLDPARQGGAVATIKIAQAIKGEATGTVRVTIPHSETLSAGIWQKGGVEILVCLVDAQRSVPEEKRHGTGPEYVVRGNWGGEICMIPLDGTADRRAPTLDFVFLTKGQEIVDRATQLVKAGAGEKIERNSDGKYPSLEIAIPFSSVMDEDLHSMSGNYLAAPVDEVGLAKARDWAKSKSPELRGNAVRMLAQAKSDKNIAILKGMLTDPEIQHTTSERWYPIREAAQKALKAWGVEADAVVREARPEGR